jgi:hypothetical protein
MPSFEAEIGEDDRTSATFIPVPFDVKAEFGKARAPVMVTVAGYTFRSTVATYGGEYMIPLNKPRRAAAGVSAGEVVSVTVEADSEPRVVELPADVRAALDAAGLLEQWSAQSYSHQREHVDWIDEAKRLETRGRRIGKLVDSLR